MRIIFFRLLLKYRVVRIVFESKKNNLNSLLVDNKRFLRVAKDEPSLGNSESSPLLLSTSLEHLREIPSLCLLDPLSKKIRSCSLLLNSCSNELDSFGSRGIKGNGIKNWESFRFKKLVEILNLSISWRFL